MTPHELHKAKDKDIIASLFEDQVMIGDALPFDELMNACAEVAERANATAKPQKENQQP